MSKTKAQQAERPTSKAAQARAEQEEYREQLRGLLKPGDSVYSMVRSVSASGMSRNISFFIPVKSEYNKNGMAIRDITHFMYKAGIGNLSRSGRPIEVGLQVSGCGMDMCFECVYNLGRVLWPKDTKKPHGTRNGEPDRDGGYALKSERM